jgi:RNA polymerase sigma factor (TIGR02999 family)
MTDNITRILSAAEKGDPHAAEELLPLVYAELRRLAAQKMAHEKPGQTLDATGLVHEAYLRLVPGGPASPNQKRWDGRGHFFAAAAEAMRRILVDAARKNSRVKHGGGRARVPLDDLPIGEDRNEDELLALDEALDRLAGKDPVAARLVHLRYFVGMPIPDAAEILGVSPRTADRLWAYARAFIHSEIRAI